MRTTSRRARRMPRLGMVAAVILLSSVGVGAGTAVAQAATAPAKHHHGSDHAATPCAASAKACMDLASHRAWLTDGHGHITYGPVPAHGGSASAPTPRGSFQVLSKDAHFYSTQFHAPMPYSVFFQPGDAFHADNPATASNGCVHLSMAAAQRFFSTLKVGDQVQIK